MKRGRGKRVRVEASSAPAPALAPAPPPPPARKPPPPVEVGPDQPLLPFAARLPRWLVAPYEERPLRLLWFLVILAVIYAAGVLVRLNWLAQFGWEAEAVQWHGVPFLTSSDGYYFAAGLDAALAGDTFGRLRIPLPEDHAVVALGYVVAKLFSWSPDATALYLPAVVGPLIAVPIACIGRLVGRSAVGLVGALFAVVAPGYYMRTIAGYFDTDMFAVTIPLVVIACLIASAVAKKPARAGAWGIAGTALLAAYTFFYDQAAPLALVIAGVAIIHRVVWHRTDTWTWPLVATLGLSQAALAWPVRVVLTIIVALALWAAQTHLHPRLPTKLARLARIAVPIAIALYGFASTRGLTSATKKFDHFAGASAEVAPPAGNGEEPAPGGEPVFGDTTRFVAEAQKLPLDALGKRTVGHLFLAVLGGLGLLVLLLRQRAIVLLAPIAGLGLLSIWLGLRFTIYLSPVAALGLGWAVVAVAGRVRHSLLNRALVVALALAAAAPALDTVLAAKPRPSILKPEVEALATLREKLQPGDLVLSWWDYGYAVNYYTRARTLVDGGQRGRDTNLVAEMMLGTSQRAAANLARLTLDALPRGGGNVAAKIFAEARQRGQSASELLAALERADTPTPAPEHDIYLYLPARMLTILPALDQLRPSEAGTKRPPLRGAPPVMAKPEGERLVLPNGAVVDGKTMTIKSARGERPLKRIHSVAGGGGRPVDVKTRDGAVTAATSGVFLRSTNLFLELDDRLLASNFVQLFAFEKPDPALFELVVANEAAKIYKLRRP